MMRALITKTLFVLSILLSAQALAFDVDGFSYNKLAGWTTAKVTGRASGNTDTDIVIPDTALDGGTTYSVTSIGDRAFCDALDGLLCRGNLTSVIIPDSVTSIGGYAFYRNALTSVNIPDGVTSIGDRAFQSNGLTSVIIPDSVTTIGLSAFSGNALTNVIIPDSVTSIRGFGSNALTSVTIGNSATTIEDGAFNNNALTSVIIPDSVTTIARIAFGVNALTSVIIPDSVTSIGGYAFYDNALTSVAFEGNFGNFNLNMFDLNSTLTTITYCAGTTDWPQGFNNGSTIIVTEPVNCSAPPDAPTIDSITAGDGQATISISVANNGGSTISSYTATCTDGSADYTGTSPTSPITVSGLTNGVSYTCSVTATNAAGTSTTSAPSAPFTPQAPTAPDAPTIDSIAAGNGQAVITFTPGADNGLPITGFTAFCVNTISDSSIVSSSTSPITVTGLNNGVSYVCVVSAANDVGNSQASEASSVTPAGDTDGDGVYDIIDNCVSISNPGQEPSAINPNCGEACVTSGCAGTFCENY